MCLMRLFMQVFSIQLAATRSGDCGDRATLPAPEYLARFLDSSVGSFLVHSADLLPRA